MKKSTRFLLPGMIAGRHFIFITTAALMLASVSGCRKDHTTPHENESQVQLRTTMRTLWSDHMTWTYATVNAFFNNKSSLQPTLNRLLQNQKDIGASIVPYYGQAAGDKLTELLTTHIQQAVPVLQAAQAGDQSALDKALSDWYANAREIADFLSAANPSNWPKHDMEEMMKGHISTTVTYSVDLLKGDFENSIIHFELANHHMMMMADMLSEGIIKQFPDKF